MAKFRDFGVGKQNEDREPISFKLHNEEFICVPQIQGVVLLELVASSGSDNNTDSVRAITNFFADVLEDESYKRFSKLIRDKKRVVDASTLGEIVGWVVSQYGDRPESQPEV
jgi:hypothetical protein